MNEEVETLRQRLQDLHELHTTGFVDDAQYAESLVVLERRLIDAVMKAETPAPVAAPPVAAPGVLSAAERASDAAPRAPRASRASRTSRTSRSPPRWAMWLGAAACVHGVVFGLYAWSTRGASAPAGTGAAAPLAAAPSAEPPASAAAVVLDGPAPAGVSISTFASTPVAASVAELEARAQAMPAAASAAADGIRGTVSLAAALRARARPDDTLFVYARAVDGPPMPLAVIRKQVRDLPLRFKLDDAMAMWPAARVSAFERVVVTARVSRSGEGQPRAGDLEGHSPVVAAGAADLQIEIGSVVSR